MRDLQDTGHLAMSAWLPPYACVQINMPWIVKERSREKQVAMNKYPGKKKGKKGFVIGIERKSVKWSFQKPR